MAKDEKKPIGSILGDINPARTSRPNGEVIRVRNPDEEDMDSMRGGSRRDWTEQSGSWDVTERSSGGTGTDVGGTRNYRQGTGFTGSDIGSRPESKTWKWRR